MIHFPAFFGSNIVSFLLRAGLFIIFVIFFGGWGVLIYIGFDLIVIDYIVMRMIFGYRLMASSDVLVNDFHYVIGYYVKLDRKMEDLQAVKKQLIDSRQGLERFCTYPVWMMGKYYEKEIRGSELKEQFERALVTIEDTF